MERSDTLLERYKVIARVVPCHYCYCGEGKSDMVAKGRGCDGAGQMRRMSVIGHG